MSLLSESGRGKEQSFLDWVNADSFDIPPEIVYPPKADDHGHGHGDDHGHDDHGHDEHGHEEAHAYEEHGHEEVHEEHGHEAEAHDEHEEHGHHGTPSLPQPSREETRMAEVAEKNEKEEEKRRARAEKMAALEKARAEAPKDAPIAKGYRIIAAVAGVLLALVLVITVAALPKFGSETAPAVNEVSARYLESGLKETGAVNSVAAVILDYRAFDTLGESVVLFTATVTVIFLLFQFKRNKEDGYGDLDDKEHYGGMRSLPSKVVFGITIPFILLYGIYVVLHGHLSPGGGFSGGTILGGALVLCHLVFGEDYTKRFISVGRCMKIMAGGLFVYIILKSYSILTGANEIASAVPLGKAGSILSGGLIFPLNICVGLVVACTIYAMYHMFTGWKE